MPDEMVCPRCQRANDARSEFCERCGRWLQDVSRRADANQQRDKVSEDADDIQEELASVRRQLTEATTLVGDLHNRVSRLEARLSRDGDIPATSSPSPRGIAEDGARQSVDLPEQAVEAELAYSAKVPAERDETSETRQRGVDGPEIGLRIDWEQVLGKNWFAIIGGIAVVLGIGFFLKLAFDNNWIGDTARIVLGVVVGLAFLGVGEYAQRRAPRWAQAVTASGAAILYLSIYAAFGLYELIRPDVAFVLLAVVVSVAALLALRYESIVIALLGVAGAFISPALLGPDLPDARLALLYILLVDVGILGISTFRNWRWLTLVGLAASYGIFGYWLFEFQGYNPVTTHIILTGVFITFAASTPLFHILWRRMPNAADFSLMSVNAVAYFALTAAILWSDYEGRFGLIAFSLAAFYGLMAFAALKRSGAHARVSVFAMGIASVFLTMAFPLQFSGYSVAVAWAAQGAVTVWMGFYLGRWQTRAFGVAVLWLAVCHLVVFDFWVDAAGYTPILNGRFPTMVAVIAAFYIAGLTYWRNRKSEGQLEIERWATPVTLGIANLVTLAFLSLEIVNYLDSGTFSWNSILDVVERASSLDSGAQLGLTLLWAVYGSAVAAIGMLMRLPTARWGGLAVLGAAVWKLLTYDAFLDADALTFTPLLNMRFLTFALVLGLLSVLAFRFKRDEQYLTAHEKPVVFPILLAASNVVALWMLSQEIIYYFDSLEAMQGRDYFNGMQLSLTVLWAVYGTAAVAVGMLMRYGPARWGGLGLLGLAVLKLLVFDAFSVEIASLGFVPLANVRFIAFALALALLSGLAFWYKRRELILGVEEKPVFPILLAASNVVALWMLSQEIIYYFGSLEARQAMDYSSAMHLSLTVLWAVYSMGAISAGIVAQSSRIRLAGIGLLAIPVAKLFAFDVFLLDLPYRVVAFITLGCLLLGMGLVYQRYSHAVRGFLFGTRTDAERGEG